MKIYHQLGHRYNWNIDCFKDNIGDGLIFSPVNIDSDKLENFNTEIKSRGFIDPQLYLLNEDKGTSNTYPFFPGNILSDFDTNDLSQNSEIIAQRCIDYQIKNNFQYIIIPTRYNEVYPSTYYEQMKDYFINPFCLLKSKSGSTKKILLTIIINNTILNDKVKNSEVLNWITGLINIDGVYLIFENNFTTKQIKDFDFLFNAIKFISILKQNELEVHIGYNNTEGFLYSIAMPDSITIGSYENLRSFGIKRFQDLEKTTMRSPNARLYSSKLLQWIDYQYIDAMKKLISNYDDYFDDSIYKPLIFEPDFNWHFNKSELYKHYFVIFINQCKLLPKLQKDRIDFVKTYVRNAIALFNIIEDKVFLDGDSNGSHLPSWVNVINAFQQSLD